MTRKNALEIIKEEYAVLTPASILRMFEGLGMLKLDEPKSAEDRVFSIIRQRVGDTYASDLVDDLKAAGLRIVEK